jgi:hypothetical protein
MISRALELIGYGAMVLPLHGVAYDRDGKPACSCTKPDTCRSPAKHPRTPNGLLNASRDPKIVAAWWKKWPGANLGMLTGAPSGMVVLDVDPRHGGNDSLDDLMAKYGKIDTAEVITGGDGRHLFFRHPGGIVRNSAGGIAPGLDIRGDGGYVVGVGSTHITGKTYDWELSSTPELSGIAAMPDWLLELTKQKAAADAIRPTAAGSVGEGKRNDWLCSLGGYLRARGANENAIARCLWALNNEHCNPALTADEVRAIAKSVARYAPMVTK